MFSGQSVDAEEGRGRKRRSWRRRPCVMQLEFQPSFFQFMEAPQFQFIDSVPDTPVACRDRYAECTLCRLLETPQVQFLDKFGMPVVLTTGALVHFEETLESSLTGLACPLRADSVGGPDAQKTLGSIVALTRCACTSLCMDRASLVQTVQKTSGGAADAVRLGCGSGVTEMEFSRGCGDKCRRWSSQRRKSWRFRTRSSWTRVKPVVAQRQVPEWFRQCFSLWRCRSLSTVVDILVAAQRQWAGDLSPVRALH